MRRLIGLTALVLALASFPTNVRSDAIALYGDTLRTDCTAMPNTFLVAAFYL